MPASQDRRIAILKTVVFALCLFPALHLGWNFANGGLGANPIEALIRSLGDWTLRLLLITLAVTPARRLLGWPGALRYRRMLGLFSFTYALLHLAAYVVLDQFFDWPEIGRDILKHPFITLGMAAFLLLLPLAATSTKSMIQRLGGRRWQRLHRLIYLIGILSVLHFLWMVKLDIREPVFHGLILAWLLGLRLWWYRKDRRGR